MAALRRESDPLAGLRPEAALFCARCGNATLARLGVTLSTGRGGLGGELRLSVAAAAAATGGLAIVVR